MKYPKAVPLPRLSILLAVAATFFCEKAPAAPAAVFDRNGITLVDPQLTAGRPYLYGAMAAHVLGFAVSPDSFGGLSKRAGVEGLMGGLRDQTKQATEPSPVPIHLTLDAQIQYLAETAMRDAGVTRGAVVVMNPQNGDILAMASFPNYDPNLLKGEAKAGAWQALSSDPASPLLNRALHAASPGSTFKIVVALAGLESGKVTTGTSFYCPGSIQIGNHLFHNSDDADAGQMTVAHAIEVSNDVFFYQCGIRTGIEAIDQLATRAGFGQKWNVLGDADEDSGIVPGPDWMKQNKDWLIGTHNTSTWSDAQTANTSIGQGFVTATPLQLTTLVSAVANGGIVYRPRLVSPIENARSNDRPTPNGQVFAKLDVKPANLQVVQQAMLGVVQKGTATLAQIPGIEIAGKTGTAQTITHIDGISRRDVNAWFCCYAPFTSPRYTVTVMVQGGTWGGITSAPIARHILTGLFALENGHGVTLKPLSTVKADLSIMK